MVKRTAFGDFPSDPDQPARRAELAAFVGPHADAFLRQYDLLRARTTRGAGGGRVATFRPSFIVLVFFLGPVWLFYRRMWLWAWVLTGVYVVLGLLPHASRIGLPLAVALAVTGRQAYVLWAVNRIARMRAAAVPPPSPSSRRPAACRPGRAGSAVRFWSGSWF